MSSGLRKLNGHTWSLRDVNPNPADVVRRIQQNHPNARLTFCCQCGTKDRCVSFDDSAKLRERLIWGLDCREACQMNVMFRFVDERLGHEGVLDTAPGEEVMIKPDSGRVWIRGQVLPGVIAQPRDIPEADPLRDQVRKARGEFVRADLSSVELLSTEVSPLV